MQDPIRNAIKVAYKDGKFSNAKKIDTQQKVQNQKKKFLPFGVTIIATCFVAVLTIFLLTSSDENIYQLKGTSSSQLAPNDVAPAYMNRFEEFKELLLYRKIDEEKRLQYLAESDWLLQRAIKSGESVFYNSQGFSEEEIYNLNSLLFYMYEYVANPSEEIQFAIGDIQSFEQLRVKAKELSNTLASLTNNEYISTAQEQTATNSSFLNADFPQQLVTISVFLFFSTLLYRNWKGNRNLFFGFIQVFILIFLLWIICFGNDAYMRFGHDETTLMQETLTQIESDIDLVGGENLSYAATFGNYRYALINLYDDVSAFSSFERSDDAYIYQGAQWGKQKFFTEHVFVDDETRIFVIATQEGHTASRIDLIGDGKLGTFTINIEPGKANIYGIYIPSSFNSFSTAIYDTNEELLH